MDNRNDKIVLPKEVQIRMLRFFLRTSIPRKAKLKKSCLNKESKGRKKE